MAKRRPGKPKPLTYELIEREYLIGERLYRLLDELVELYHEELREARIALAWCTSWKPDVDGRVTLGKCVKASDLHRELAPYDFVILLSRPFFEDPLVKPEQCRALVDHELCVPPWTRVSGPERELAISRRYSGQLVRIRTALGYELSVTQNHPVLTPRGFVRADTLIEGEDVFCGGWREGEAPRVDPYVGEVEPTIEQIASTSRLVTGLVPEPAEDFDPEIAVHEVDIPFTDRHLVTERQTEVLQHYSEFAFSWRDAVLMLLARLSCFLQRRHRVTLAGPRSMRGLRIGTREIGMVLRTLRLGLRERPRFDPEPSKPFSHNGRRYATLQTQFPSGRPVLIALDQIVRIFNEPYRGHVFNLQTVGSWFSANGIITHNCHAAVKHDSKGEPAVDGRGRIIYRIRKHDLEEFSAIASRYGCWKRDLEQFASALDRARHKSPDYWIGTARLRDLLQAAGLTVPLDVISTWTQQERREAEEWAVLREELSRLEGSGLSVDPPAHVASVMASAERSA